MSTIASHKPNISSILVDYSLGEDISSIILDMMSISDKEKCVVETVFNDKRITVSNKDARRVYYVK